MKKEQYLKLVEKVTPKENQKVDYLNAFLFGGLIGFLGEGLKIFIINYFNLTVENAISYILIITIFIACLFTALGFFDNFVAKFKCGIIIPITGFAHSIMSCALDYKNDGLITGIGSNFFKLAGSVILYGMVSGFICRIIKVIINV